MKVNRLAVIAGATALALIASHAGATQYVVNGGFETGDTTGWTEAGNWSDPYNHINSGSYGPVYDGAYDFGDGAYNYDGVGGLSQVLATTAGQDYEISLWWAVTESNTDGNQLYQVLWNNDVVGQIVDAPATGFTHLTFDVVGAGNDTLTFQGYSTAGYNFTDDVSVTNIQGGVPEPATWSLMISGFGLAGAALRRRRRLLVAV